MKRFTVKKYLGQHFLHDKSIAQKIITALSKKTQLLVEVGPGKGILTEFLAQQYPKLYLVEVDLELVAYLKHTFPLLKRRIIAADFLQLALDQLWSGPLTIIGNFPYNISSQIFFKVLENRQQVHEVVGMIQKEVAERFVAQPGSKAYGILSVLLQAFFKIEYLFTVGPQVFHPPPKVQSAVIRLQRNNTLQLKCDEKKFFSIVKAGFQQRRKVLRNALKPLWAADRPNLPLLDRRAEQLTVEDFVMLTQAFG